MQAPAHAMVGTPTQMAGGLMPPSIPMAAIPQAQLQAAMQAQHRMSLQAQQPDMNLVMQARRIQDQQRAAVQMQQAQHQAAQQVTQQGPQMGQANPGQQASPSRIRTMPMNGMNQQSFMANAQAMMASFNAANNAQMATSPGAGLSIARRGSSIPERFHADGSADQCPRQQAPGVRGTNTGQNPNLAPEQVHRLASEALSKLVQRDPQLHSHQQAAMSAAAGALAQKGALP